jgi:hypothetical protein
MKNPLCLVIISKTNMGILFHLSVLTRGVVMMSQKGARRCGEVIAYLLLIYFHANSTNPGYEQVAPHVDRAFKIVAGHSARTNISIHE